MTKPSARVACSLPLSLAALAAPALAQCELEGSNLELFAAFGSTLAVSGDRVAVVAPSDEFGPGQRFGSVRIFERGNSEWIETATLVDPIPVHDGSFGDGGMDLDGESLAVAGDGVHVYGRGLTGWDFVQTLLASDSTPQEGFGVSLVLRGDVLVVGASRAAEGALERVGAVYVFERHAGVWTEVQKLVSSELQVDGRFGASVAFDGRRILVGAPLESDDTGAEDTGAAYLFERDLSGWHEVARLAASPTIPDDYLGTNVALDGDVALLATETNYDLDGRVFVFERSGPSWHQTDVLGPSAGSPEDLFALSMSLVGDTAFVGAPGVKAGGLQVGAVFRFERGASGWSIAERIVIPEILPVAEFPAFLGAAVDASERWTVLGAPTEGVDVAGKAWVLPRDNFVVYECDCLSSGPCGQKASLGGCVNSTGLGGVLAFCGSPSVARDDLRLETRRLPAHAWGLLAMSDGVGSMPFGDGRFCLADAGLGFHRFALRSSGAEGAFAEGPGLVAYSDAHFPPAGQIQSGQTWHFQAIYRDAAGPCGFKLNASNALGVHFAP